MPDEGADESGVGLPDGQAAAKRRPPMKPKGLAKGGSLGSTEGGLRVAKQCFKRWPPCVQRQRAEAARFRVGACRGREGGFPRPKCFFARAAGGGGWAKAAVRPNPACSGHGFAVGSPWWLVGRSSVACRGGWTATPCR